MKTSALFLFFFFVATVYIPPHNGNRSNMVRKGEKKEDFSQKIHTRCRFDWRWRVLSTTSTPAER